MPTPSCKAGKSNQRRPARAARGARLLALYGITAPLRVARTSSRSGERYQGKRKSQSHLNVQMPWAPPFGAALVLQQIDMSQILGTASPCRWPASSPTHPCGAAASPRFPNSLRILGAFISPQEARSSDTAECLSFTDLAASPAS